MEYKNKGSKTNPLLLQKWETLSFMHWSVDKKIISKYIPNGLTLDLYDNGAYIGLIPFMMKMFAQDGDLVSHSYLIFQNLTSGLM